MPLTSTLGRTVSQAAPAAAHYCSKDHCEQIVAEGLPPTGLLPKHHMTNSTGSVDGAVGFRSWTEELQAFRPSPTGEKDGWGGGV